MGLKFSKFLNQRGIALPAVVIISTVVLGGVTLIMRNNVAEKNTKFATRNVSTDTIISGVFVYADSLLKERRCIDKDNGAILGNDVCDPDVHWDNEGNLARLLISDDTAGQIAALPDLSYPKLTTFEFQVDRGDFGRDHPMRVLMEAERTRYDSMKIRYDVIEDDQGIEGYFFINTTVSLYVGDDVKLTGSQKSLYAPQMVNNYSLVLNRNLSLDDSRDPAGYDNDDNRQPNMLSNKKNGRLIFESPVLVNEDIIIPRENSPKTNNTIFRSRVDFGGKIKTHDAGVVENFQAQKGGRTIAQYPGFLGFRGGVRSIPMDPSLDAMFKKNLTDPSAPRFDFTVETECPKWTDRKENCLGISTSQVIFQHIANTDNNKYEFWLGMSQQNEFLPLNATNAGINEYYDSGNGIEVTGQKADNAIVRVKFKNGAELGDMDPVLSEDEKKFFEGTNEMKQLVAIGNIKEFDFGELPDPEQFETTKQIRLNGTDKNKISINLQPFMRLQETAVDEFKDKVQIDGADKPKWETRKVTCKCTDPPSPTCAWDLPGDLEDSGEILTESAVVPAETTLPTCNNGKKGDDEDKTTHFLEGAETDFALQDRPNVWLDITFEGRTTDPEQAPHATNYKVKTTVEIRFETGHKDFFKPFPDGHWEWILGPYDGGAKQVLFSVEMTPFDFTFSSDGTEADSGQCQTGPHKNPPETRSLIIRMENKNSTVMKIYDNAGDIELDPTKWFSVAGVDAGAVPTMSPEELRSLNDANATPEDTRPPNYQESCGTVSVADAVPVSVNADFRKNAFDSWNFNPVSKKHQYRPENPDDSGYASLYSPANGSSSYGNRMIFDDHNHNLFHVYSILDYCEIKSGADHVLGFVICRRMKIENRSTELNMIGTFVVDQLEIDSNAYNQDIKFMNIFHPAARELLVNNKILRDNCQTDPNSPFWSVSGADAGDDYKKIQDCRPADIMKKADPFRWTSFKPECGTLEGTLRSCIPKGLYKNFASFILNEKYER